MPEVRLTLRLDADDTPVLGHGKIRLLEKLAETGSISAAGRAMGMSYRRTWLLVDSLNQLFSSPVVTTRTGGGGATVTQLGLAVLALYRKMEAEAAVACAEDMARLRRLLAGQKTKT